MAQNMATPMAENEIKNLSIGVAVFFGIFRSGRQVSWT